MKLVQYFLMIAALAVAGCEKDNYDGPTAGLAGRFLDVETGELVQQDIIRGTQIEIIEHGYDPASPQYLIVKVDGTYENSLLFENTYTVQPKRGNFVAIAPQDLMIKGRTTLDFTVTPYIRILSPSITKKRQQDRGHFQAGAKRGEQRAQNRPVCAQGYTGRRTDAAAGGGANAECRFKSGYYIPARDRSAGQQHHFETRH